jgi:hypothetical protein
VTLKSARISLQDVFKYTRFKMNSITLRRWYPSYLRTKPTHLPEGVDFECVTLPTATDEDYESIANLVIEKSPVMKPFLCCEFMEKTTIFNSSSAKEEGFFMNAVSHYTNLEDPNILSEPDNRLSGSDTDGVVSVARVWRISTAEQRVDFGKWLANNKLGVFAQENTCVMRSFVYSSALDPEPTNAINPSSDGEQEEEEEEEEEEEKDGADRQLTKQSLQVAMSKIDDMKESMSEHDFLRVSNALKRTFDQVDK